jgi:outer membrane protein assembly factor BamD (BamD/ComL family)
MFAVLRAAGPLILAAALTAPLQCGRTPPPDQRMEDDPAEVLYTLAERLKASGDPAGRAETLRFLVARYPESRFARAARADLGIASP